jgi:hypothetical protein
MVAYLRVKARHDARSPSDDYHRFGTLKDKFCVDAIYVRVPERLAEGAPARFQSPAPLALYLTDYKPHAIPVQILAPDWVRSVLYLHRGLVILMA